MSGLNLKAGAISFVNPDNKHENPVKISYKKPALFTKNPWPDS
jgi:hypothetical protein